jgi:hypothetical protein
VLLSKVHQLDKQATSFQYTQEIKKEYMQQLLEVWKSPFINIISNVTFSDENCGDFQNSTEPNQLI